MNANQQSALSALGAVRPVYGRLDGSRHPEDLAADIIELWSGTETALRALLGGSSLSGQALIRELRQRELITLGQAHALLAFQDAKEKAERTSYQPTQQDIALARDGYQCLDAGLREGTAGVVGMIGAATSASPRRDNTYATPVNNMYSDGMADDDVVAARSRSKRIPTWAWAGIAALSLLLVAGAAWYAFTRDDGGDLTVAIEHMKAGRREAARTEFAKYTRENPDEAEPHVFLARLAREENDEFTARRELETAIRLEPKNSAALREMGLLLYSGGNYELSRRFFVRALQNNPSDLSSQGYLGCALMRLRRPDEAQRFLSRAGSGSWSSCARDFVSPTQAYNQPLPPIQ